MSNICERLRQFFKNIKMKNTCISTCCVDTIVIEKKHNHKHKHKHKDEEKIDNSTDLNTS